MDFNTVTQFELDLAKWWGSPYAVATDCCTHAIELCMRHKKVKHFTVPKRTYISVPFLANKLNITFDWRDEKWKDFYYVGDTNIIDAAVLWKEGSYIKNTFMCLSFQYKKHLSLGRGGMILLDNEKDSKELRKMSYDGRERNDIPWTNQEIKTYGYHYYMTPETAEEGLRKFSHAVNSPPRECEITDWPDLSKMPVFGYKNGSEK